MTEIPDSLAVSGYFSYNTAVEFACSGLLLAGLTAGNLNLYWTLGFIARSVPMKQTIAWVSNFVGLIGVVMCAAAGLFRMTGQFYIAGYEVVTVFNAGVGVMMFSALLKLELIYQANKD